MTYRKSKLRHIVTAIAVSTLALLALAACAPAAPVDGHKKEIKIAFSIIKLDDNYNAIIGKMKERAVVLGKKIGTKITIDVYDAQGSLDKQLSDIQTVIVKKPNLLLVDPVDAAGIAPGVKAARAAGIITVNNRPSGNDPKVYDATIVGDFESKYSEVTKSWVKKLLDDDPKLVLNVGLLYGAQAQAQQLQRGDTYKELAAKYPERVKIVAEKYTDWSLETAQNTTTDFMLAHPNMNLVVAASSAMALGAYNAVAAAGREGDVRIAAYDLDPTLVQDILDGKIAFTAGNNFADFGQLTDVLVDVNNGTYAGSWSPKPIYAVTKDNAAEVLTAIKP